MKPDLSLRTVDDDRGWPPLSGRCPEPMAISWFDAEGEITQRKVERKKGLCIRSRVEDERDEQLERSREEDAVKRPEALRNTN